jgi:TonB family protein
MKTFLALAGLGLLLAVTSRAAAPAVDQQPVPTFQRRPVYPYSLRANGVKGEVLLDFIVDPAGEVRNPIVVKSTHPDFESPAVEALLAWKFKPGLKAGRPVATHMMVPIEFTLEGGGVSAFTVSRQPPKDLPPQFQYDEPPRPVLTSAPVYPFALLEKKTKGSATVMFAIDPTGVPRNITVREATRPEFGAATAAMIAGWHFEPAKKHGQPAWALLGKKQFFDRGGRDSPVNDSAVRLLKVLQQTPSPVLDGLGELDARPQPRFQPSPVLPEAMAAAGAAAEAEIEFILDRSGHAQLPRIISASREDFGWAAATAVARWQFTAPARGGQPVDVRVRIPFTYSPPPANRPAVKP